MPQIVFLKITLMLMVIFATLGFARNYTVYETPSPKISTVDTKEKTTEPEKATPDSIVIEENKKNKEKESAAKIEEETALVTQPDSEIAEELQKEAVVKQEEEEAISREMQIQETLIEPSVLNQKIREAVINIFCLSGSGSFSYPGSASGVIIDERGIILTNAHIAQYFLLKDYPSPGNIECTIRTGSPAKPEYRGELLFMPTVWVEENKKTLKLKTSYSTGEHDYALIRITESTNSALTLPGTFPFLAVDVGTSRLRHNEPLMLGGYPAGFLSGFSITKDLWLISTVSSIHDIYTFRADTPDVIAVKGAPIAQEGSSGGVFVDFVTGKLLGIITTRTAGETTEERELRALSLHYINHDFEESAGETLESYVAGDIEERALVFKTQISPYLTGLIASEP